MKYHDEIITVASLQEDVEKFKNSQPKMEQLRVNVGNRRNECFLESTIDDSLLTTRQACAYLGCSKATLWSYAKTGVIKRWQRKKGGLTRWPGSELRKI
jgi:predicted DNA-binding transcriptional regulator AlpA